MPKINNPLYIEIYNEIKQRIIQKKIKAGSKIDSVRSFSKKRGISTTTVERAYNQLLIEGYLYSKPRSGYIVQDLHVNKQSSDTSTFKPIPFRLYRNNQLSHDLFDVKTYKSIMNKVLNYNSKEMFEACHPSGELELREEIQKYVRQERNVLCDVNQIIIGPGIQHLLQILFHLEKKSKVTYLKPEFKKAIDLFKANNYSVHGAQDINEIISCDSDYLYISPSNMYPTGDIVKVSDRHRLLGWAKSQNSYIIEDDYNYFIRYNSYTIPSIMSLDQSNKVVYMGSFSKILLPSIRISFMILPKDLYELYKQNYHIFSQGVSKLEQLTLSLYMKEGLFKRHTKKLHSLYQKKNDMITSELDKLQVSYRGNDSNLHVIIDFENHQELVYFMKASNRLRLQYEKIDDTYSVIFPYSGLEVEEIPHIIKHLFQ